MSPRDLFSVAVRTIGLLTTVGILSVWLTAMTGGLATLGLGLVLLVLAGPIARMSYPSAFEERVDPS